MSVGAAIHSVRAVGPEDLAAIASGLDEVLGTDAPLHVHLSEQPAENEACLAATGITPTGLLARHGLLSPRLSAVHATHLTAEDIAALGAARNDDRDVPDHRGGPGRRDRPGPRSGRRRRGDRARQ